MLCRVVVSPRVVVVVVLSCRVVLLCCGCVLYPHVTVSYKEPIYNAYTPIGLKGQYYERSSKFLCKLC